MAQRIDLRLRQTKEEFDFPKYSKDQNFFHQITELQFDVTETFHLLMNPFIFPTEKMTTEMSEKEKDAALFGVLNQHRGGAKVETIQGTYLFFFIISFLLAFAFP